MQMEYTSLRQEKVKKIQSLQKEDTRKDAKASRAVQMKQKIAEAKISKTRSQEKKKSKSASSDNKKPK